MKNETYSVRCLFEWENWPDKTKKHLYEERITIWSAADIDVAIRLAEGEAEKYAEGIDATYLNIAQAYHLVKSLETKGDEVFSLLRDSDLEPTDYLDAFFDTGNERQRT